MSEHFVPRHERQQKHEALPSPERHEALPDAEHAEPLRPGEADPLQKLQAARQEAERHANQDNPVQRLEQANQAPSLPQPTFVNHELKRITLQRELNHIRRKLSVPDRALSQVIHQPAVRALSQAAGESVTRPSGLLGGGLVAFVGSLGYLYMAKHLGFTYNYVVLWVLFAAGFVFGLVLEMLVWVVASRRRSHV